MAEGIGNGKGVIIGDAEGVELDLGSEVFSNSNSLTGVISLI
jgi:hypothetical protein